MTREEEETIEMLKILKEQALSSCNDTAIIDVKKDSFIFVINMAIKLLEQEDRQCYIKDKHTKKVRLYGEDPHDSLRISSDGTCLTYYHLQCGEGSLAGDKEHSSYVFCDDEGQTPEEDDVLCRHGADAYFNIGGF